MVSTDAIISSTILVGLFFYIISNKFEIGLIAMVSAIAGPVIALSLDESKKVEE